MTVADGALAPQTVLAHIFGSLDSAGVSYCLLHPPGDPETGADVDFVVSPALPSRMAAILREAAVRTGYLLVQAFDRDNGVGFVLAGRAPDGSSRVLKLDASTHPTVSGHRFYSGAQLLSGRRRESGFWVPTIPIEFGCSVTRRVVKGALSDEQAARLSALCTADAAGCAREAERFWGPEPAGALIAAARAGAWQVVREELPHMRDELLRGARHRASWQAAVRAIARTWVRARHGLRPVSGLHVLFLGPDGAGKSTVIHAIARELRGIFSGTVLQTTAPSLSAIRDGTFRTRALKLPGMPLARPHSLRPHSPFLSLVQAAYWSVYYIAGYQLTTRPQLARGRLVLQHRGLVDALVDPKRYRYGGPRWLLRPIWRLAPKPDLLILLDAAPAQMRARKPELQVEEITRQRREYLTLVKGVPYARVVDASLTPERTVADVSDILFRFMADRVVRRIDRRGRRRKRM